MAKPGINRRAGMTLVELIVFLSAVTTITFVGLKIVTVNLERLQEANSKAAEWAALLDLRTSLTKAWDQRFSAPDGAHPWLELAGRDTPEGLDLNRILIRSYGPGGRLIDHEWKKGEDSWIYREWTVGAAGEKVLERPLAFSGSIETDSLAGLYFRSGTPMSIHFRFPDIQDAHLRQGFAIREYW